MLTPTNNYESEYMTNFKKERYKNDELGGWWEMKFDAGEANRAWHRAYLIQSMDKNIALIKISTAKLNQDLYTLYIYYPKDKAHNILENIQDIFKYKLKKIVYNTRNQPNLIERMLVI